MIRFNIMLAVLLVICALALVTSQHKARNLFVELQKQQEFSRQLEVEFGQLQLEQSTWAMHSRVEKIAANSLRMRVPDGARVHRVPPLPAPFKP
jgi:cell division protein FtsL